MPTFPQLTEADRGYEFAADDDVAEPDTPGLSLGHFLGDLNGVTERKLSDQQTEVLKRVVSADRLVTVGMENGMADLPRPWN